MIKPGPDFKKEYKPDSYKKSLVLKRGVRSESQVREEKEIKKSQREKLEELWEHMGLDNGTVFSFNIFI